MAWLSGYTYRKKITITGQAGASTNYQVKLLIGKASGATGEHFDLEGHCLDTMLDMRFTDNDETTQIDYWIESVAASGTSYLATVWIEVRDTLESNADIYIYYGKAGDTDGSSGANTFLQYHGAASTPFKDSAICPPNNVAFEVKFKRTANGHPTDGYGNCGVGFVNADISDYIRFQNYNFDNTRGFYTGNEGTSTRITETPNLTLDVYYRLLFTSISTVVRGYVDGDEIAAGSTTNLPDEDLGLEMWVAHDTVTCLQDFSFARKFVATEPAYSSAGVEETESAVNTTNFFLMF